MQRAGRHDFVEAQTFFPAVRRAEGIGRRKICAGSGGSANCERLYRIDNIRKCSNARSASREHSRPRKSRFFICGEGTEPRCEWEPLERISLLTGPKFLLAPGRS